MATKITDTMLRKMEPPASGSRTIWDTDVTGFGVRVTPATKRKPRGSISFFLNYRIDGAERRYTIGAYTGPDGAWTASAARDAAREMRRAISLGRDPAQEKRERRDAPTVKDLADRYYTEHLPNKAEHSQKTDRAIIETYILPRIGKMKVADVGHGDIASMHRAITASGKPVRANRVLACASKMFSLALRPAEGETKPWRDQAAGNPCKGVARNQEEGHDRFFSPAELAALSDALSDTPAANCIRLVMLTGCRPGEAMAATWDQFDLASGVWTKPSAHTKQRKAHRVPLPPAAVELLATLWKIRRRDNEHVFPGQKAGARLKQIRTAWENATNAATVALWADAGDPALRALVADLRASLGREPTIRECRDMAEHRAIELPPGLTDARIYDLRHTFASIGAASGMGLPIIGRLLGHTQARTTQRYAHLADDPLREATAKIAGVIGGAGKAGAEILDFRKVSK